MTAPIPNITGGAATAGNIESGVDASFGPVSIGGLFGSSSNASSDNTLLYVAIAAGVLFAFMQMRKR